MPLDLLPGPQRHELQRPHDDLTEMPDDQFARHGLLGMCRRVGIGQRCCR
jgi:hypothetical protein